MSVRKWMLSAALRILRKRGKFMSATILIVDDEPAQLELLRYNLEKAGFETVQADNGRRAIDLVEDTDPDLVVLDWMMPEASGIDVCRELRARATTRLLPIIMLSARGEEGDRAPIA